MTEETQKSYDKQREMSRTMTTETSNNYKLVLSVNVFVQRLAVSEATSSCTLRRLCSLVDVGNGVLLQQSTCWQNRSPLYVGNNQRGSSWSSIERHVEDVWRLYISVRDAHVPASHCGCCPNCIVGSAFEPLVKETLSLESGDCPQRHMFAAAAVYWDVFQKLHFKRINTARWYWPVTVVVFYNVKMSVFDTLSWDKHTLTFYFFLQTFCKICFKGRVWHSAKYAN